MRAQADVSARHVLTEDLPPAPTDAYGRSKLLAEQQLAQFDLDWVALRLPLVFGTGVKGNMATLLKLARSPLPLPFGALRAQRSLLSLENLLSALLLLIRSQEPLRRPLIVADPAPLSVPEMIGAMRSAVGRRAAIFPVPAALLRTAFRLGGRAELYRRIAEPLIADPTQLLQMGWVPGMKTQDALAALARAGP